MANNNPTFNFQEQKSEIKPDLIKENASIEFDSVSQDDSLKLFQDLFHNFNENELKAIQSLKVGIRLKRVNSSLVKYVTYPGIAGDVDKDVTNQVNKEGLDRFINAVLEIKSGMGPGWNSANLDLIPKEIERNWNAATLLPNHENWFVAANGGHGLMNIFKFPKITKPKMVNGELERHFEVNFHFAVVDSDNESISSIMQLSPKIELPKNFYDLSQSEKENWLNNLLEENQGYLKTYFASLSELKLKAFEPKIKIVWSVDNPDGGHSYPYESMTTDWHKTPKGNKWLEEQRKRVFESCERISEWFTLYALNEAAKRPLADMQDNLDRVVRTEDWELLEIPQPQTLEDFDKVMSELKDSNNNALFHYIYNSALKNTMAINFTDFTGLWKNAVWEHMPALREKILGREWVDEKMIDLFSAVEQKSFRDAFEGEYQKVDLSILDSKEDNLSWQEMLSNPHFTEEDFNKDIEYLVSKNKLLSFVSNLSDRQKSVFMDLMYWNNIELDTTTRFFVENMLTKSGNDLRVALLRGLAKNTPQEKVTGKTLAVSLVKSNMDWSDLFSHFEMTEEDLNESDVKSSSISPFLKRMARLNPPKDVSLATQRWLANNERFNEINRSILHKKGSEEANLSSQLADKLRKVIEISNKVIEESNKSGGFWGRVRNNFASKEANPEEWADAFSDFQDHMLKMLVTINKQIERDKVWLRYADDISSSAIKVDNMWASWLAESASELEKERNDLGDNVTSERKINWNNRVDILKSSRASHEHIRVSNTITQVMLKKVKQSVELKERLHQRTKMFYWSSLNMFAGLQTIQRNTNNLLEQSELATAMATSFEGLAKRSVQEEYEQKENIRKAFKEMTQSEAGMKKFYETIANLQKDTVIILEEMNSVRTEMASETAESMSVNVVRKKRMAQALDTESDIKEIKIPTSKK